MSDFSRDKMQLTVELLKRGAVMMKEPCPACNGVQIRYRDKIYCTSHEELAPALSLSEVTVEDVLGSLREVVLGRMRNVTLMLKEENDLQKQRELVTLLSGYLAVLKELPEGET